MKLINIYKDEYYPYFGTTETPGFHTRQILLTEKQLSDYKEVMSRFESWQKTFRAFYDDAEGAIVHDSINEPEEIKK